MFPQPHLLSYLIRNAVSLEECVQMAGMQIHSILEMSVLIYCVLMQWCKVSLNDSYFHSLFLNWRRVLAGLNVSLTFLSLHCGSVRK